MESRIETEQQAWRKVHSHRKLLSNERLEQHRKSANKVCSGSVCTRDEWSIADCALSSFSLPSLDFYVKLFL